MTPGSRVWPRALVCAFHLVPLILVYQRALVLAIILVARERTAADKIQQILL